MNVLLRKFWQKYGTLVSCSVDIGPNLGPDICFLDEKFCGCPQYFYFSHGRKGFKLRFGVVWHKYAIPTSTLFSNSLFFICTMNIVHGNIHSRFPTTDILTDICHSLTLAISWEQWTQSNTGHLSVSNWLSLNMTQVKAVISVQSTLVVLTFHLFGFCVANIVCQSLSFDLSRRISTTGWSAYDSASADRLSCQHTSGAMHTSWCVRQLRLPWAYVSRCWMHEKKTHFIWNIII